MNPPRPPVDPAAEALDEHALDALHQALAETAGPADPQSLARIKHRLMQRIAADVLPQHRTVLPEAGEWRPAGAGLLLKKLHADGGTWSYLLRLAPGARLPAHRHPTDEECVVLEGQMCIGDDIRLGPGGYHRGQAGVPHAELWSETGALLFLHGAAPKAELLL